MLLLQWKYVRRNYARERYSIANLVDTAITEDECANGIHVKYYAELAQNRHLNKLDFQHACSSVRQLANCL